MTLVTTKELVTKAQREHYAVGAFNAINMEADRKGEPRKYDIRKMLAPARDAMRETVAGRMVVFGCVGEAD